MTYPQRLAELLARAVIQFEGCKVTWAAARIYYDAINEIECEDLKVKEDAIKMLRALVTEK